MIPRSTTNLFFKMIFKSIGFVLMFLVRGHADRNKKNSETTEENPTQNKDS